jgi:hypothetical protein
LTESRVITKAKHLFRRGQFRHKGVTTLVDILDPQKTLDPEHISIADGYKINRDYVTDENVLIHNRMMWFLVPVSFLLPTFGLCVNKLLEAGLTVEKLPIFYYNRVLAIALCVIGMALSIFSARAVRRADIALELLNRRWEEVRKRGVPVSVDLLPPLTGGGGLYSIPYLTSKGDIKKCKEKVGISVPVLLPLFFAAFWGAALLALVFPHVVFLIGKHLPAFSFS